MLATTTTIFTPLFTTIFIMDTLTLPLPLPLELINIIYGFLSKKDLNELSLTNKMNRYLVGCLPYNEIMSRNRFIESLYLLYSKNKWIYKQFYNSKNEAILDISILYKYYKSINDIYDFIYIYENYFYEKMPFSGDDEIHFIGNIGNYVYYFNYCCEGQDGNDRYTFILSHKDYFDKDNIIKRSFDNMNLHCDLKDKYGLTLHSMIVYNRSFDNYFCDEIYWFNNGVLNNTDENHKGELFPAIIYCKLKLLNDEFFNYAYYRIKKIIKKEYYIDSHEYNPKCHISSLFMDNIDNIIDNMDFSSFKKGHLRW